MADESVADYLASLMKLASTCKFGDFPSDALKDRFVCGLHSEDIQKSLLTKVNLTWDSVLITALCIMHGTASKRMKELKESQYSTPFFLVEKMGLP